MMKLTCVCFLQISYIDFMIAVMGVLGLFAFLYIFTFITFCFKCSE